jgi:cell pole-organizing protein PopZ
MPVDSMSEAKGQHEPSMEEILASIRRIIAEDGEAGAPAAAPAKPEPAGEDVLELTEVVEDEPPKAKEEPPPKPPEPAPAPPPRAAEPPPPPAPVPAPQPALTADEPIVSAATAAASVAALSRIADLSGGGGNVALGDGYLTLEQMVRQELRAILREWLDAHLPGMVERIVRSEIQRLVQGVPRR